MAMKITQKLQHKIKRQKKLTGSTDMAGQGRDMFNWTVTQFNARRKFSVMLVVTVNYRKRAIEKGKTPVRRTDPNCWTVHLKIAL